MRVTADRDVCIGAGLCALTAPEVFDQGDDGLVTVLSPDPGPHGKAVRQAAVLCPSGAVQIVEE
ncbi:MAG TPA: (4Fe-4S)-binding protein [Streptosporangiaceae bacterium]